LSAADVQRSTGGDAVAAVTPTSVDVSAEQAEQELGLTRNGRQRVQLALKFLGYDIGGADGVIGPKSRTAIAAWQADQGQTATGFITAPQHKILLDQAAPQLASWDAEQKRKAEAARLAAEAEEEGEVPSTITEGAPAAKKAPQSQPQALTEAEPEPAPTTAPAAQEPEGDETLDTFFSIMGKTIPLIK